MIHQAHNTVQMDQVDNGRDNVTRGHPVGKNLKQAAAVKVLAWESRANKTEGSQGYRKGRQNWARGEGEERWLKNDSTKFTFLWLKEQ